MQSGDIFHIDSDAILDMENEEFSVIWKDKQKNEHRLAVGTQFRVSKSLAEDLAVNEVRGSKIDPVTGKCGRGRPRRFPAAVVYRLLGEVMPDPAAAVVVPQDVVVVSGSVPNAIPTVIDTQAPVPAPEPVAVIEQVESTDEEKAAAEARVASLLGLVGDDSTDNDW